MHLRDLPRPARLLVVGTAATGVAALAACLFLPPAQDVVSATIFLVLAFVVAWKRVKIHVASISLGFVVVLAALFHCGTLVAVAAAVINTLACFLVRDPGEAKPNGVVIVYNASALAVAAFAAGGAHGWVGPAAEGMGLPWPELWGGAAAVVAYHGLSVASLGLITTLCRSELDIRRWWRELLATAPAYFAGGAMALALDQALVYTGRWAFVVGLPFAYLIHSAYRTQAESVRKELRLLRERAESGEKMAHLYLSVVEVLSNAIDVKDHGTLQHVQRVHSLARAVAEGLGLMGDELEAVKIGAVLHDIGKLAVPDHILHKPGRLTDAEFRMVQQHAAAGEAILRPIDFGVPVANIIRHHHEKLDGTGYPDGLAGDEIAPGARILAVIDVYDALVSDRPYRKAWTSEMALEQLRKEAGASFDPVVVEALAEALAAGVADSVSDADGTPALLIGPPGEPAAPSDTDELIENRVAEKARHYVLQGLVDLTHGLHRALAIVAYELAPSGVEIDAVAAVGPAAGQFDLLRLPVACGVSGRAAREGSVSVGSAAGEFASLARATPEDLGGAAVTALPIVGSSGRSLAVLSLYHADPARSEAFVSDPTVRAALALAARQLERVGGVPRIPAELPPWPEAQVFLAETAGGA